ncbi:MAG: hypothetical protein ACR2MY_13510 [Candidatus Dormibacteria bacterium]
MVITALRMRGLAVAATVALAAPALASCSGGAKATPTPSPSKAAVVDVPLSDFNGRLGSNRVAAETAVLLGRKLYETGQYWEVYVRTAPATLAGKYDPADPSASAKAAAAVTQVDVIIATESGSAIKSFAAGGDAHERRILASLDTPLRQAFPNAGTETIRIFYGESFQHGVAVFNHGTLTQYTVRSLG